MKVRDTWSEAYEFACRSKACAPPPVGTGGSRGGGARRATPLSVNSTPAQFRRAAEAAFKRGNPDAKGAKLTWIEKPRKVKFPTGNRGFVGAMQVEAPGYRTRTMRASWVEGGGLMVR